MECCCRFEETLPMMPVLPVPKVNHLHPKCTSNGDTTNISTRTPLSQLDSTRYFASHFAEENIPSPIYKSSYSAEEYKFLVPSQGDTSHRHTLTIEDFLTSINTDILRIIFLALDAMLLLYRFSHTYINATTLCRGFEDSLSPTGDNDMFNSTTSGSSSSSSRKAVLQNGGRGAMSAGRTSEHMRLKHEKEVTFAGPAPAAESIRDYNAPLEHQRHPPLGHKPPNIPPAPNRSGAGGCSGGSTNGFHPKHSLGASASTSRDLMCRETVSKVLQSNTVPKILLGAAVLILFYILVTIVCTVVDLDVILAYDGFSVFLQGLDVQVNQTNWYLQDQADHFNQVTMTIYQGQMRSELLNLQSMLDYFSIGEYSGAVHARKFKQLRFVCS